MAALEINFTGQPMLCSWLIFLDVWGDFLVLTHTLVSLPVNLCHFLCLSLGNGESRYCWGNLWACVEMLILNKNMHCSVLYVLQLNEFLWLMTSKNAVIDQNKLTYHSVSVTGDCLCHCTRWCLLTTSQLTHWFQNVLCRAHQLHTILFSQNSRISEIC